MNYNEYVKGKCLFEQHVAYEKPCVKAYNDFIIENDLSEFISDMKFGLNEAPKYGKDGGAGFIKKLINRKKIRNNGKAYAQAYMAWKMVEVEKKKLMHSDQWEESNTKQKEIKSEAFKAKETAAKDRATNIEARIDQLGKSAGVEDFASAVKTKAKVAATENVMKVAKQVYTENQYKELETHYENLSAEATKADEILKKAEQEGKDMYKKLKNDKAYKAVSDDRFDAEDYPEDEYETVPAQDDEGKKWVFVKKTAKEEPKEEPKKEEQKSEPKEKETPKEEPKETKAEVKAETTKDDEIKKLGEEVAAARKALGAAVTAHTEAKKDGKSDAEVQKLDLAISDANVAYKKKLEELKKKQGQQ